MLQNLQENLRSPRLQRAQVLIRRPPAPVAATRHIVDDGGFDAGVLDARLVVAGHFADLVGFEGRGGGGDEEVGEEDCDVFVVVGEDGGVEGCGVCGRRSACGVVWACCAEGGADEGGVDAEVFEVGGLEIGTDVGVWVVGDGCVVACGGGVGWM